MAQAKRSRTKGAATRRAKTGQVESGYPGQFPGRRELERLIRQIVLEVLNRRQSEISVPPFILSDHGVLLLRIDGLIYSINQNDLLQYRRQHLETDARVIQFLDDNPGARNVENAMRVVQIAMSEGG